MQVIPREQVIGRLRTENPWWEAPHAIQERYHELRPRTYFQPFFTLTVDRRVRRAVILLGPRRVGKTVLIHQTIQRLIEEGQDPRRLCYVSVDHPLYNGCSLQDFLDYFGEAVDKDLSSGPYYVFLDEIQYLKDWELHLKALVDGSDHIRFVASGSAAAALRLKSVESGAGRFTDFLLPPLTFHEYLDLKGDGDLVEWPGEGKDGEEDSWATTTDITLLNNAFVNYLNFGGYPEVVLSSVIQSDPGRFIKGDIIDRVLLRDLPSLYGIADIQELNALFTTLAFNTANEVSLEDLSRNSRAAKGTLKKYIEYLEAAFLLKIVHRVDRNGKRFQRATHFKVYLTNPSLRAALFSPVSRDDEAMGQLAETAIFAQWFHSTLPLHYARWADGEVDIVALGAPQKPIWAVEVKWSDRHLSRASELLKAIRFCKRHKLPEITFTTKTLTGTRVIEGIEAEFIPAAIYCYTVGRNVVKGLFAPPAEDQAQPSLFR